MNNYTLYELEQFRLFKKDIEYFKSGHIKKAYATLFRHGKAIEKVRINTLTSDLKIEDLIGKKFLATIINFNNTNYITQCYIIK